MKTAYVKLRSASPYSQSAPVQTPKSRDETHDDHEARTWRERCHVDDEGKVFIPPMSFKNALSEAAKYKSTKVPGTRGATYTKHLEAGVLVVQPLSLGVKVEDVEGERLFVPSDGRRGGSKRVWKTFPRFPKWEGVVEFIILDDLIDEQVFRQTLTDAGEFIGIGRFRPRNNGFYGRFGIVEIKWEES